MTDRATTADAAAADGRPASAAEPLAVPADPREGLTDLLLDVVRADPGFVLHRRRAPAALRGGGGSGDAAGPWLDVTAAQFADAARALAAGFAASGVRPGDRVGLLSRTRWEWTLVDFALWWAGAVPVPVYETSSAEQAAWVLADSGAVACVVEAPHHAALLAGAAGDLPDLARVWTIDDGDLDALAALGADPARAVDPAELERRRALAGADDLATVIYTSGTTGRPRGCRLTHGNLVVLARQAVAAVPEVFTGAGASCLLFLPLAHVFARFVEVLCVAGPVTMGHVPDTTALAQDMGSFRPTFVLAVPRVFEKLYAGAEQKALEAGRGAVFARAAAVAGAVGAAREAGRTPPLGLRAQHALFERLVYRKLRAVLGGRATHAVSGGGPLGERLGRFFSGAGVVVLQGYGLTETSAPVTVNRPATARAGTVGRPLPGCEVRIDAAGGAGSGAGSGAAGGADGEVLVRGPGLFAGYWGRPDADAEALTEDGWLRTGDLGSLDADGHLRITGRLKEIIVTSGGKNVAPAVLEDALRAHPLVGQAVVVGDARPYVAALLVLDPEALPGWLRSRGLPALDPAAAAADERVRAELQGAVDAANARVSRAESVRRFAVLDAELTEASGHLTPSLKLRRQVVLADLAPRVDALYASEA